MNIKLNKREEKIIKILLKEKISFSSLIEEFRLSKRNIQYSLNNINYILEKNKLEKIRIKNDELIFNPKSLKSILVNNEIELNKSDRQNILTLHAIFKNDGLNISKLSNKLDVSRNTLQTDMASLEYTFEYVHKKGYFVSIDEYTKRQILVNNLLKTGYKPYIEDIFDYNLLEEIKKFILEISEIIKFNIYDEMYLKLIVYIYYILTFDNSNIEKINFNLQNDEYTKVKKIYLKYFNKDKFDKIFNLLIGFSITPNIESWINESFLLRKMIRNISSQINVNLTNDSILFDFLLSHFKVSIYRLKNNIPVSNVSYFIEDSLLKIIKENVFEFENEFDISFTKEELILLAFHIKAAILRQQKNYKKIVLLFCGLGYGSSKILEYNLKEYFDVEIVDVLSIHEYQYKDRYENIDVVLSTTKLEGAVYINPLLKNEDLQKLINLGLPLKKSKKIKLEDFVSYISQNIKNIEKDKLKKLMIYRYKQHFDIEDNYLEMEKYLEKNKVIFKNKVKNWQQAIEIVGKSLVNKGSVSNKYIENILENIKNLGAYIVISDNIAIPHAQSDENVFFTDISMLILKEPVKMFDKYVKVFFAFSSKDKTEHLEFLKEFYNLILDNEFLEKIDSINTYEQLLSYIKEKNV